MSEEQLHQLLPWFLTGTLDRSEERAFRNHLAECAECRDEMAMLEKVRDGADRHGAAYLSEHPPAERLVALVRDELEDADRRTVREHLALCPTCALESRWVAGKAVAGREPAATIGRSAAAPSRGRWIPLAAAAAVLLLALSLFVFRQPGSGPMMLQAVYLTAAERGSGVQIVRTKGDLPLLLIVAAELSDEGFPVTVELLDRAGKAVLRQQGVTRDLLDNEQYAFLTCPVATCGPGDYRVRISPSKGAEPPVELRFRIELP